MFRIIKVRDIPRRFEKEDIERIFLDECPGLKGNHRDYNLPDVGTKFDHGQIEFSVRGELDVTPNPACRYERWYGYYEFGLCVPYWDEEPKIIDLKDENACFTMTAGGTPERWGKLVRLSVKQLNEFILSDFNISIRDWRYTEERLKDALRKLYR